MNFRRKRSRCLLILFLMLIILSLAGFQRPGLIVDLGSYGGYYGFDSSNRPISQENNLWRGKTVAQEVEIPEATWTCTDDHLPEKEKDTKDNRRTRQCVVENMCVDRSGAFIRGRGGFRMENMPKVNLLSSDEDSDVFWQPRVDRIWSKSMKAYYVNETLFVHGLYAPYHFSHWLYNESLTFINILHQINLAMTVNHFSTMKRFGGTKNSWTLRAARYFADDHKRQGKWEMEHFFETGQELVLSQYELSTPFQSLPPPDAPICFRRAVVGLGSQCALVYCARNIPADIYRSFRDEIAKYYWETPSIWQKHLDFMRETFIGSTKETHENSKNKDGNSPLKCLEMARYYNFEGLSVGHAPEHGEKPNRIGQMFPDVADPSEAHDTENGKGENTNRKFVVGIIQREGSRSLINDQILIDSLADAGFRVKWMSFDHGCGLAETAYLLRDVNVLISPHGNAIGASLFMPSDAVPTMISIDTTRYWESWFKFTATAIGQRFISTYCGPTQYPDEATKEACPLVEVTKDRSLYLRTHKIVLGVPGSMVPTPEEKKKMSERQLDSMFNRHTAYVMNHPEAKALEREETEMMFGPNLPEPLIGKYGDNVWSVLEDYWKSIPRYVNVPLVTKFVQKLQVDFDSEIQKKLENNSNENITLVEKTYGQYVEYVRKGVACGFDSCENILDRNVIQETSGFGQYSTDDIAKWGQQKPGSQALRQNIKELKNWKIEEY
ncbi:hypothetical protein BGZ80_000805 [Entomortierella chlamydospora]|uniref:Glycosyltransferase family 61 protein n=1 Tax=Entomortierella chlamydospora TaxID=101097 RepID=A0A9P6MS56_9FUNG|nr:hypothetical protein BGZ80_000805 [Entomortierella chlamydospora]